MPSRLRLALSLIVVAAVVGVAVIAGAAPGFGGSQTTDSSSGPPGTKLKRTLGELSHTRHELRRARDRLRSRADRADALRRRLERSSRLLGRIRAAAGQDLPLTDDACSLNLAVAAARGLELPGEFALHCPGPGLDWNGASHWGVTCPYSDCPEGSGPYISISNPTYYVVAHELCHAIFGYTGSRDDELRADACAQAHGASLAASPYN
jgi:hypothetical protein